MGSGDISPDKSTLPSRLYFFGGAPSPPFLVKPHPGRGGGGACLCCAVLCSAASSPTGSTKGGWEKSGGAYRTMFSVLLRIFIIIRIMLQKALPTTGHRASARALIYCDKGPQSIRPHVSTDVIRASFLRGNTAFKRNIHHWHAESWARFFTSHQLEIVYMLPLKTPLHARVLVSMTTRHMLS